MKLTTTTMPDSNQTGLGQSLANAELRYRHLFEFAQYGILILNAQTGAICDVNPYLIELLGCSRQDILEKKLWEVAVFKEVAASRNSFLAFQKNESVRYENLPLKTKNGQLRQVEFVSTVYLAGDEKVIQCEIRDISTRKPFEAAMLAKEAGLGLLINNLPVGVLIHDPDTRIVLCNPEASQLLGISSHQLLGKDARDPLWHLLREDGTRMPLDEFPVQQVIATGQVLKNFVVGFDRGRDKGVTWVLVNAYPRFDSDERLHQVVVMVTDISAIKCEEEVIQRHLEHLTALVEIDRAINFSFDLNLSLTTLLTHAIVQLEIDAADVLLFDAKTRTLEYVAGRGFHTKAIENSRQHLGKGYAGRAARERRIISIPDLEKEHDRFLRGMLLAGEEFVSYYGVPLLAKGQVMGVLEVFHRTKVQRDEEWLDFLKALASQAAIAIENVTLFENLQHSNTELFQAYSATIEGWSRALELRDNETEGHTQRVADLTVKLARLFGLSDAELVQVRWGALLHDIGKMGIPDKILFKHDKLTEAEWEVMKKHPVFAYEMLSPIRYLRSALDIPYAHHEMWDGSGYPFGLKGEQIPLVARIFAVVDVWDALRSDRRYRTSWTVAKVRKHLRSLSGSHFDPQVVTVCLESNFLVE
ncbi:MAG: PAS domain S-box protein [Deltaproteobacteria bacterium]|nr:PAS domain S-box protein [Deltaproteobacteria bacterium]